MDQHAQTLLQLMFLWLGILVTRFALEGTPPDEWTSEAVKIGLACTAGVIVVAVVAALVRRRARPGKLHGKTDV